MLGENKRCANCMNLVGNAVVCQHCGYSKDSPYPKEYLAPGTLLNGRYVLGRVKNINSESATYIAYDNEIQMVITIKEFMPKALVLRDQTRGNLHIQPGFEPQYKNLLADFLELGNKLIPLKLIQSITHVYEVFQGNNTAYWVSEYTGDTTLNDYLEEREDECSWEETSSLLEPVLKALINVHKAGILHQGLSPQTIKINSKGVIKLDGFSINALRSAEDVIEPELFKGYAAPEQYSMNSIHGTWTDVYGIAAVMYRMLTGVTPPDAKGRTINDNIAPLQTLNPNIPLNVAKSLSEALKMSPNLRMVTIKELYIKLFMEKELSQQDREKVKEVKEKKPMSRRKMVLMIAGITVAVISIILVIIVIFIQTRNSSDNDSSNISSVESSEIDSSSSSSKASSRASSSSASSYVVTTTMPNLVDSSYNVVAANQDYRSVFNLADPVYEYHDDYDKGIIFSQDIEAGTQIQPGTTVTVKVSRGPRKVQIPSFTNKTEAQYIAELNELEIKYEIVYESDSSYKDGQVIKLQDRNVGDMYDRTLSGVVTVIVAKT